MSQKTNKKSAILLVELLQLTGILALYPEPVVESDFNKFVLSFPYPHDEQIIQFEIRCKEFREYIILIDTGAKTIKNELIIGHEKYRGACLKCLNSQVRFATEAGYLLLTLDAWYQQEPYLYEVPGKKGEEIPWTGYRVWGKYGFIMDEYDRNQIFVKAMKENGHNEDYIHELYLETQNSDLARNRWDTLCLSWEGVFDLSDGSLSRQILQGISGRPSKKP